MAKIDEVTLMRVFNDKTFSRNEAASIVGGLTRLYRLVGQGKIRAEKKTMKQNGKWFCNAWDCIKYCSIK